VIRLQRAHVRSAGPALAALVAASLAAAGPTDAAVTTYSNPLDRQLEVFLGAQTNYDDNLFRLPAHLSTQAAGLGADVSRVDRIDVVSAGVSYSWLPRLQDFEVAAGLSYNRFANNTSLNNTSRYAKLEWNWRLAERWSGRAGANYEQLLANFANNHFFAKDILQTAAYFGSIDWQIGSHLFLDANARHTTTTHSAVARQYENYAADSGGFGVNYLTQDADEFGWEYRYTHGSYPHNVELTGIPFNQRYDESTSGLHVKYMLTGKTTFEGSVGILKRDYPSSTIGDFSGDVWHAGVTWAPGAKTQIVFDAWRQLTAYLDSQSDYFVSNGFSIAPTWNPTEKLSFSVKYSRDRDRYIGTSLGPTSLPDARHETVASGKLTAVWTPIDRLRVTAAYRFERRRSTESLFTYGDNLESLDVRFVL
jgi:Putative beta-barrel porin 2